MSKSETQWDDSLPWHRFNRMMQVFSALPTLPLHEWTIRYLVLIAARHSQITGKGELFSSAIVTSLLSSLVSLIFSQSRVKFPAQANVMISPRQSLHELELTAVALYVSSLAARRHGGLQRSALAEACLAGLLCHLFQSPCNVNGPRFLWWTWHRSHPSVKDRVLNFPANQAVLELTGGFAFNLMSNWVLNLTRAYTQAPPVIPLLDAVKTWLPWLPEDNRKVAETVATALDSVRNQLSLAHPVFRVVCVGVTLPVLQHVMSILAQVFAMDRLGCPTVRSYKLLIALFTLVASRSVPARMMPVTIKESKAGATLAASVVGFFAVQFMISLVGEATKHVSTGAHQRFGRSSVSEMKRDVFGNRFDPVVSTTNGDDLDFTVEGNTRSDMLEDLNNKRDCLDDAGKFLQAADKRVRDTELALQETLAWSKQAGKQVPHLQENEFVREMEAANSVRVARIKLHLETKLEAQKVEKRRISQFEQSMRAKISLLENLLEVGSVDPAGNSVIPASLFGPGTVWYTIRGVAPANKPEEVFGVFLLCALGMTAFTKALAFGT